MAILGDSITRYFAFTLNYFLKTGEIAEDGFGGKWGGAKRGGDPLKWRGSDYFDEGDIWTDGMYLCGNQISGAPRHRSDNVTHTGVYSTRADHRQVIDQRRSGVPRLRLR